MAANRPLSLNEWMERTRTTNRELQRLTEEIDPENVGVCESTIRGVRKGENHTIRVALLLVGASRRKPAVVEEQNCSIWWETLYAL